MWQSVCTNYETQERQFTNLNDEKMATTISTPGTTAVVGVRLQQIFTFCMAGNAIYLFVRICAFYKNIPAIQR